MAEFDLAVVGADPAGLAIAAGAAQLGASVLLVADEWTTDSGWASKHALLAVARAARCVREAARFGVSAGDPQIAWDRVRAHMRNAVNSASPASPEARLRALGATVLRGGEARFVDPATIRVGSKAVIARRFVVAIGDRAATPVIDALDRIPFWTTESLPDMEQAPDHLLILGGGSVGLESADAFSGLGSRVTLLEAGRIARDDDLNW